MKIGGDPEIFERPRLRGPPTGDDGYRGPRCFDRGQLGCTDLWRRKAEDTHSPGQLPQGSARFLEELARLG